MLGVLGVHNLVQNSVLNEKGYVAGNLGVAALLVVIGRLSGTSWSDMGLSMENPTNDLKFGGLIAAVGASGAIAALSHPRTREPFHDGRWIDATPREILKRATIRFPIGTALFEEVAFRGVLPAVIGGDRRRADVMSATVFALWHLIPTVRLQHDSWRGWPLHRQVAATLGGSAAAGVGGVGLSWLRRRTGSLLAPWLVHATVNSAAYLAGVVRSRFGGDLSHAMR